MNWPPPFTLKISVRARAVRLQVCRRWGLRLIAPLGFNPKEALSVLKKQRAWIERAWLKVQPIASPDQQKVFPNCLILQALGEKWQVAYISREIRGVRIKADEKEQFLSVGGEIHDPLKVKKALRKWLHTRAQAYLFPWLEGLSKETGLVYEQVKARYASTRWGSCSAKKNISLSPNLLFIDPLLVEHVLLHELCHTVHFNHSSAFWDLLKIFSPDTDSLRKEIRKLSAKYPFD